MAVIAIPLAEGFEEIEAVAIIDVLRRAGNEVIVAGVDTLEPCGANGITLKADCAIESLSSDALDMIILPGGWGGTKVLASHVTVQCLLQEMNMKNKHIGAICAAPFALFKAGVLKEGYTCYPSVEEQISIQGYRADLSVVTTDNVVTSRGPATAICFALEIVKMLNGEESYQSLKNGLLASFC